MSDLASSFTASHPALRRAIVAGHICLDIIPQIDPIPGGRLDAILQPGKMLLVGPAAIATGGAVSNTGLALHRLGIPTELAAKIGDDAFGQVICDVVDAYGPRLSQGLIRDARVGSSYTVIISPPEIDRIFLHCSGANNEFTAADVSDERLAQAALLHFGYPPVMRRMYENGAAQMIELFRRAKAAGATTSLDMTFPDPNSPGGQADWPAIFKSLLPFVDVFAPSIDELLFMLRRETYARLAALPGGLLEALTPALLSSLGAELLEMGARIVVIKTGSRGAYLRTAGAEQMQQLGRAAPSDAAAWANVELWAPCFAVDVVGTTGSGDATIAGFLSALLRDLGPRQAMTAATAVGACNVEAADALSGLRPWEETMARVAAGWPRRVWALDAPGWGWDAAQQVWLATCSP